MKFSAVVFFLFTSLLAQAQNLVVNDSSKIRATTTSLRSLSISLSFFNHAVSTPFNKIFRATLHPGFQAGIEGKYFETDRSKLFQTLNAGVYYNRYNGTGIYLNTELAFRFTTKPRIFAEVLVGIGYLRVYHPTDIYELNSTGTYQKAGDNGFSSPLVSGAIGLGYSIRSTSSLSFAPFIRYEILVQTKYSADLDVLPQTALHVGVRIEKKRLR